MPSFVPSLQMAKPAQSSCSNTNEINAPGLGSVPPKQPDAEGDTGQRQHTQVDKGCPDGYADGRLHFSRRSKPKIREEVIAVRQRKPVSYGPQYCGEFLSWTE